MTHEKNIEYMHGVCSLISRINHACIQNCHRSFIGDMQVIRVTRDLDAGTELFFSYKPPERFFTYEETQNELQSWGFTCACALCLARQKTTGATVKKRKDLWETAGRIMEKFIANTGRVRSAKLKRLKELHKQLEGTYSADERAPDGVRLEICDGYFKILLLFDNYAEAIEVVKKGLEALGFIITACPPRLNSEPQNGPTGYHMKQWGLADKELLNALMTLFRAYKKLAPELSVAVKNHVETAYGMVVGEKDTILEVYPELASC